jgi:phosphoribosylanthranilate isomerase
MIAGIRIKVCGITTLVDAEAADACGADFLGFIFYEKSPRFVPLAQWRAMAPRLPPRRKVAVSVMPAADDLRAWAEAGFDFFQVHFPVETSAATLAAWSAAVGADRLWLAPKLPPGAAFPTTVLEHGRTVLWDTYAKDAFGGSGRTGDWAAYRAAREAHTKTNWILAGGLSPGNVAAALAATGARWLDVNSGVESAPGVKDPAKLGAFFAAVRAGASGEPAK